MMNIIMDCMDENPIYLDWLGLKVDRHDSVHNGYDCLRCTAMLRNENTTEYFRLEEPKIHDYAED